LKLDLLLRKYLINKYFVSINRSNRSVKQNVFKLVARESVLVLDNLKNCSSKRVKE